MMNDDDNDELVRLQHPSMTDLSPRVKNLLIDLKQALASDHPEMHHVQVTFDHLEAQDVPPRLDYIGYPMERH